MIRNRIPGLLDLQPQDTPDPFALMRAWQAPAIAPPTSPLLPGEMTGADFMTTAAPAIAPALPSIGPEADAVIATAPRAQPVTVDRSGLVAPVYDTRTANRARTVGGVAALVGALGLLATGDTNPLSALAAGVAGGAGNVRGTLDADFARRSAAYTAGVTGANEADARYRNEFDRSLDQTARTEYTQNALNARSEAGITARAVEGEANRGARANADLLREAGDAFDTALEAGDVDGAVRIAERMGLDPEAARSTATTVQTALAAEERRKGRALSLQEQRVVIAQSGAARSWAALAETQRHNRVTEANAGRSSGGGRPWIERERDAAYSAYARGEIDEVGYRDRVRRAQSVADGDPGDGATAAPIRNPGATARALFYTDGAERAADYLQGLVDSGAITEAEALRIEDGL